MSSPDSIWSTPPHNLLLSEDEVHVWRANLRSSHLQSLEQSLAPDERARADRFRFPKDRIHFVVARGVLRAILSRYRGRDAQTLQFRYNQYGKPSLAEETGPQALSFNVTHSHEMALYAITRNRDIGIDIEHISPKVDYGSIAERFFSPYEVHMFRAVPVHMQQKAFYACWTRKEAYLKARGMGLAMDLNLFDVSFTPDAPAALLHTREKGQHASRWSLYDLFPDPAYAAALAVEGKNLPLRCWQWPET